MDIPAFAEYLARFLAMVLRNLVGNGLLLTGLLPYVLECIMHITVPFLLYLFKPSLVYTCKPAITT